METYSNARKWWVFAAMSILIVLVNIDIAAVNLALVSIAADLNVQMVTMQWVINGYLIAAAAVMAVGGRLGDFYGQQKICMLGTLLFVVAALAVGLAEGEISIISARIVQGAAMGFAYPLAMVLGRNVFPEKQRGTAIGWLMAISGAALAAGPSVGGFFVHFLSWRWLFLIDLPFGLLAFVMMFFTYKRPQNLMVQKNLDYLGVALLVFGLFSVLFVLNEMNRWGMPGWLLALFIVGVAALVGLFFWERRTPAPILHVRLLGNRAFIITNLTRMAAQFILFTLLFVFSLLLQNILGYSALNAGLLLLTVTVVLTVVAPFAGKLTDRIGSLWVMLIGTAWLSLAGFSLLLLTVQHSTPVLMGLLLAVGIGFSLVFTSTSNASLENVPSAEAGSASGIFYTNMLIAAAIGVALAGWLLNHQSQHKLLVLLAAASLQLTASQQQMLTGMASGLVPLTHMTQHLNAATARSLVPLVQSAFFAGYVSIIGLSAGLVLLALLLLIWQKLRA